MSPNHFHMVTFYDFLILNMIVPIYHKQLVSKSSRFLPKATFWESGLMLHVSWSKPWKTLVSCIFLGPARVHTSFRSFKLISIPAVFLMVYLGAFCYPIRCELLFFVFRRSVCQWAARPPLLCSVHFCRTVGPWDLVLRTIMTDEEAVEWHWLSLAAGSCFLQYSLAHCWLGFHLSNWFSAGLVIWEAHSAS